MRPFVTGRSYTLIFNGSVKYSGAAGLTLSGSPRPVSRTAFPCLRPIAAPLKVAQFVSPSFTDQPPPFKSRMQIRRQPNQRAGQHTTTVLLVSGIKKSALVGNAADDKEFYLGVLHDGEL
jgi:hypothetical protein